jgi:hypothetical protein
VALPPRKANTSCFKSKDIEVTKITAKNEEYDILTDKYEVVVTAAGGLSRRFLLEEKQARLIKLLKAKNNDLSMRMMANNQGNGEKRSSLPGR